MKKMLLLLVVLSYLLVACVKTNDAPSLHEQLEGRWRVASHTEERYNQTNNSVTTHVFAGRPSDEMVFDTRSRLHVKFDTAPPAIWIYKAVNANTLSIDGKHWTIVKLDKRNLELSLRNRDSSLKIRETVRFELTRP